MSDISKNFFERNVKTAFREPIVLLHRCSHALEIFLIKRHKYCILENIDEEDITEKGNSWFPKYSIFVTPIKQKLAKIGKQMSSETSTMMNYFLLSSSKCLTRYLAFFREQQLKSISCKTFCNKIKGPSLRHPDNTSLRYTVYIFGKLTRYEEV